MKIKNLKTWEEVKDKKYKITSLKHGEYPEDYLYQNSNGLYTPTIRLDDFSLFRKNESSNWNWSRH